MKEKLLISFSSGKTSAFMTWYILNHHADACDDIVIVMANTGKERQESLLFAKQCESLFGRPVVWVEAAVNFGQRKRTGFKVVTYETAARNGEPFEAVIKKYGIPNKSFPHCTRELKTNPIHSYVKSLGWKKYKTAIGIRADEMDRINWEDRKRKNYWYPLADAGITKKDVEEFWSKQDFTLQLKPYEGNCDFCWKKSIKKLKHLAQENPVVVDWWREMEQKYGYYIPEGRMDSQHKPPYHFGRQNLAVDEVIAKSAAETSQLDLFEYGCQETCEPF